MVYKGNNNSLKRVITAFSRCESNASCGQTWMSEMQKWKEKWRNCDGYEWVEKTHHLGQMEKTHHLRQIHKSEECRLKTPDNADDSTMTIVYQPVATNISRISDIHVDIFKRHLSLLKTWILSISVQRLQILILLAVHMSLLSSSYVPPSISLFITVSVVLSRPLHDKWSSFQLSGRFDMSACVIIQLPSLLCFILSYGSMSQ